MSRAALPTSLETALADVAAAVGCELLLVERQGSVLRVTIDHPEGVTLTHCEAVSRAASPLLDAAGVDSGRYVLEVSSPGLDRPLLRPRDYERFQGSAVRVVWRSPDEGGKLVVRGRLSGFEAREGGIAILEDGERGRILRIPLAEIVSARLEIEI